MLSLYATLAWQPPHPSPDCTMHPDLQLHLAIPTDLLLHLWSHLSTRQASLAALDLSHGGASDTGVSGAALQLWAFGAPRTGDQAFADAVSAAVPTRWRVMWRADDVADLPPAWLGYRHWEPAVWYTAPVRGWQ